MSHDAERCPLHLDIQHKSPTLLCATVIIPAAIVDKVYHQTLISQQQSVCAAGFSRGSVPLDYIAHNFKSSLNEHLKEFLFNYFVISFLYQELRARKIVITGEPRLCDIQLEPQHDARFMFEINTFAAVEIQEWKHLPFKAPKRKKYKDLDRQVDAFIKEEAELLHNHTPHIAQINDWVNFDIVFIDHQHQSLIPQHRENLWLKLGDEEIDKTLRDIFLDKKIGDTFVTNNRSLQAFFSRHLDTHYWFSITIVDILHSSYFCLDQFKKYFKLKTNKEMYQKLIEVFSYRNDLSQRRAMAEESLKLLLSKHRFEIPNHLILRQQTKVLETVQFNPDYHVYRMQKDFQKRVKQLAEKQTQELLLLDHIAYLENVTITNQDTKHYLNLIQRPRTKEFLYLAPPMTKIQGLEVPISTEELKQTCLREKTLNHIIYHLTKL